MAVVEREFSNIIIGGQTSSALIEFDNATTQLLALILRGNIDRRTVLAARGTGRGRKTGIAKQREIRLDLSAEAIRMVLNEDGMLVTPPGFVAVSEWVRPKR